MITSVEPRAFMAMPSASDSRRDSPPSSPPRKAPPNLPMLAIRMSPSVVSRSRGSFRTVISVLRPASAKKIGMNKAVISPRSWPSIWRVRMGDSPINTPATKAPSTVCTPIRCVVSAMAPMITKITVITGSSLTKLSFAQRIRACTIGRPMVRLARRKIAVPPTLLVSVAASIEPCVARLKVMAMTIQPIESSMMAEATIT